jgi:hypothetical protein
MEFNPDFIYGVMKIGHFVNEVTLMAHMMILFSLQESTAV